MLLIYTPEVTPRISYAFDIIFKYILKIEYTFTNDKDEFYNYTGTKFSYGIHKEVEGLYFGAASLLYEDDISKQHLEAIDWNGMKGFYAAKDLGFLPFDPFATSFFMVTRYEEYTAINKDKYHRYLAEESLAYTYNFLDKPIVNLYAIELKKILLSFFPNSVFPSLRFRYNPSFDIDVAFLYKHKGIVRSVIAFTEDLLRFRYKECIERVLCNLNIKLDPNDSYKKQFEVNDKYKLNPLYFILLGDFGGNDKNVPHGNINYRNLIKKIDQRYESCFHPSFGSTRTEKQLLIEKLRMEDILDKKVYKARQFFNKISMPTYYSRLVEIGITDDYSMGYNNQLGFRAGICVSYPFFNLSKNEVCNLMIHPFCIVDKSFKLHLRIRSSEVIYHSRQIMESVRSVGGDFNVIFHNETLGTRKMWKNWTSIYDDITKMALS